MNVSKMTLPYPVLGVNDDVLPLPSLRDGVPPPVKDDNNYTFTFEAVVENEDILRLIAEGRAEYVCEVDCHRTMMRKCYKGASPRFEIVLPRDGVSGRIEFEVTVTVKEPIADYVNKDAHEDYDGFAVDLTPGDILAFVAAFTYNADIQYDKLQAVGSFMTIERTAEDVSGVSLDGDKISIRLPEKLYGEYCGIVDRKVASVVHSSLVFNALMQALYNFDKHTDKLWAQTLDYRIRSAGEERLHRFYNDAGEDEAPFERAKIYGLAQALLGDPYARMFNCLQDLRAQPEDED